MLICQNNLEESKRTQYLDLKNILNAIFDYEKKAQFKEKFCLNELIFFSKFQ